MIQSQTILNAYGIYMIDVIIMLRHAIAIIGIQLIRILMISIKYYFLIDKDLITNFLY